MPTYSSSGGAIIPSSTAIYDPTSGTTSAPKPIGAAELGSAQQPYKVPQAPGDTTSNYTSALSSIDDLFASFNQPTATDTANTQNKSALQSLYERLFNKGASVGSDGKIDSTGAVLAAQDANAKARGYTGISDAYGQLKTYNSQIQALQKEALAIPLQLQQGAEGRGITAGGLAPTQTGLLRNNAIKALQLSALAQSVQGDISDAEQSAARAVELEFLPMQNQLNFLQNMYNINKDQLDREDKKRSEKLQAALSERTRLLNIAQDDKKTISAMAAATVANFPKDTAAQRAAQQALQTNNLSEAFALLGKYQQDPLKVQQILADIEASRASAANSRVQAAKTQAEVDQLTGKGGVSVQTYNERSSAINLVNTILADPNLNRAVGGGTLNPFTYIPGSNVTTVRNQMTQLTALLSLENRSKLKGSGAVSDFESKTLERSASAFSQNLGDAEAKKQLMQIRGVLTTMNGGTATVRVSNPKTGEVATGVAGTEQINKMIADGLVIEYQ